ncbi:hypothetical protein F5X71_17620 [Nocardia brasiliensis]|uniref:DUF3237 family protein n=1 Tax=Nocardia brasiliensis TaxID=37326 RepID=A0A6G9XSM8_NOCBR|nr:hypothetical protein [Nocardia brasiliensis]QIS03897.1 hypothetical protein F5X71_17620 [Nocardia brasiliensis]
MAFQLELRPAPPLPLTPECLVHTGIARLFVTGMLVQGSGAPPEQFGFFVPTAPALPAGAPEPRLLAEAYLMTGIATSTSGNFPFGVEYAQAAYAPDPRGGTDRWLYLSGAAYIGREIRIGYRVTVCS